MRPPRTTTDDDRCLPAEELTAFAAGDLSEGRRAAVSRHLLRCPACRDARDDAAGVLRALRAFGTTPGWAGDLAAARTAVRGERRSRRRAAAAGVAAAALLAAGLALAPRPSGLEPGRGAAAVVATAHDAEAQAALLRAQGADGRWSSATGGDDEAATGLALVALLAGRPPTLAEGAVPRAVADATRWLRTRQRDDGAFGSRGARGHALATQGLLEVWAASHDTGLQAVLGPAVRRLADDARRDAANPWTQGALARAHALGWRTGVEVAPAAASSPWSLPGAPDASLCSRVLAVVHRSP